MKNKLLFLSTLVLTILIKTLFAQSGGIDTTFNYNDIGFGYGDGANSDIFKTAIQNDGKIIIVGSFTKYNGYIRNYLSRLNIDGSNDTTFNIGTGANSDIQAISIQSDGKIIIGGWFTSYNGTTQNFITRLNSDGSIDPSFNIGTGANNFVKTISIQGDGKIIIGGNFTAYNGVPINRIARLNIDGSLDTSFNIGTGCNNTIYISLIQNDGKIIIGGNFTSYNGVSKNRIARINADGSIDAGFNVGTGTDSFIYSIALQSDGKIIIAGDFSHYNDLLVWRIARLNTNGSYDSSFNSGSGVGFYDIQSISIQNDGKIIIGGSFFNYNGTSANRICRINTNGSIDTSFNIGTGPDFLLYSTKIQSDGKIIIGGSFISYNGTARNHIARLNSDGSLDDSFVSGTGANNNIFTSALQTSQKNINSNEYIYIAGSFTSYNNVSINRLARVFSDGSIDNNFNIGSGANDIVYSTALQNNGNLLIGGNFTIFNGTSINRIASINSNGSLDNSFNIGSGFNYSVNTIKIQNDGKIIIGGEFTNYNGVTKNRIARLNLDASIDASFLIGSGANGSINTINVQSDGKIIIGGNFTTFNGNSKNRILRLNVDGSIDASFNVGTGANNTIYNVFIQPDGKLIICGNFTSYKGTSVNRIARINIDGSIDASFNIGTGANNSVRSVVKQNDGKLVISGDFTSFNGVLINRIVRLNIDGSIDIDFNIDSGANGSIYTCNMTNVGNIIIGGSFTAYNGIGRNRIAKLYGESPTYNIMYTSTNDNVIPYPNPMIDYVTFKILKPNYKSNNLQIYDLSGHIVYNKILIEDNERLFLNLSNGVYIYQISNSKQIISSGKIIVQ